MSPVTINDLQILDADLTNMLSVWVREQAASVPSPLPPSWSGYMTSTVLNWVYCIENIVLGV